MVSIKKKTDKAWYDLYVKQNNGLTAEQTREFFGDSVVMGYGLYGYDFIEENGEYYCRYWRGESCD